MASLREFNHAFALPSALPHLWREDLVLIAERAQREANPTYPVPEIWGQAEFVRILTGLLPPTEEPKS